jgi:hypothetical protein
MTATDTNLDKLWYSYNGTNTTIAGAKTGVLNQTTITTTLSALQIIVYANDTIGNMATPVVLNLTKDPNYPQITLNYPTPIVNYGAINGTLQLNFTATDNNLDKVWYNYNGTNVSISGALSGIYNLSNITLTSNKSVLLCGNDTAGNTNCTTFTWDYKVFENSRTANTSSYETAYESYSINVTANSSLTNVYLNFNGTYLPMTDGGTWDYSRDLPTSSVGNNSISYIFTYDGTNITSDTSYQNVLSTVMALCNATYTVPYLNLTFKDEATLTSINATMPLGEFDYYLGSGTVTKKLQYINTSENTRYSFCVSPTNRNINIDSYVQYASSGYPQRIWNPTVTAYNNTTTVQTLYLLSSADGQYVTFQVVNSADQVLSGVEVTAIREISGVDVTVATGTTSADGTTTFWLNPDFVHTLSFSKTGFTTYSTSFAPTQTGYTITLAGGGVTTSDYTRGVKYEVYPTTQQLYNNTAYTFAFNLTSSYWDIDSFGFNLRLSNGTIVASPSSSTETTAASTSYNVNNQSIIYMDYYWIVDGNYTRGSKYFIVSNTGNTQWSISHLFTRLNTYMAVGFFGLDDFGRYLIVFLALFITVGVMSYKYSLTSPVAISLMTFLVIFFFDVVVNLLPTIRGIEHLLTYLTGLILTIVVLKEMSQ